jgi:hypothetical protein
MLMNSKKTASKATPKTKTKVDPDTPKKLGPLRSTWLPKEEDEDVMPRSVSIYLPSKDKDGNFLKKIDRAKLVNGTMIFLLDRFGGSTLVEGIGYFKDEKGKVHAERSTICHSYTYSLNKEMLREIHRFANSLAGIFAQKCISVVIDGNMYFFNYDEDYDVLRKKMKKGGKVYGFEHYLTIPLAIPNPDLEG